MVSPIPLCQSIFTVRIRYRVLGSWIWHHTSDCPRELCVPRYADAGDGFSYPKWGRFGMYCHWRRRSGCCGRHDWNTLGIESAENFREVCLSLAMVEVELWIM